MELLLGLEDSEVDLRHIFRYARKKKGRKIFEIFSWKGQSEFVVASRARWDERQRVLVTQEEESRRNVRSERLDRWVVVGEAVCSCPKSFDRHFVCRLRRRICLLL